jgi:ammonium transporter, Amt family
MAARRPSAGRWTRRQLLETAGGVALIGFLAEACGPAAPSSSAGAGPAAAAATAAPTTAAAATAPVAAATAPVAAATAATTALAAATTAPAVAGPPGGQAIISFGEPDTLLMSESRALVGA